MQNEPDKTDYLGRYGIHMKEQSNKYYQNGNIVDITKMGMYK